MGQAAYDAARRERKARAAVTVAANAEAAAKARAKGRKGASLGQEDFYAKAARIEASINKTAEVEPEPEEGSYTDLTKAQLKALIAERNTDRDEATQITPESDKNAALVAALVADDESQKEES